MAPGLLLVLRPVLLRPVRVILLVLRPVRPVRAILLVLRPVWPVRVIQVPAMRRSRAGVSRRRNLQFSDRYLLPDPHRSQIPV